MPFYEHILQFIALITGLILLKKLKPSYLQYVVLLMALTCINESVIIQFIINRQYNISQDIAYNIFSIFDMVIWLLIFFKMYANNRIKMVLFIPVLFAFLYSLIDIFFITGIKKLHINSMMFYDMGVVLLTGNFLYQSLKKEFYEPLNDPLFWVSAACIGYHSLLFMNFATLWLPVDYWQQPQANKVWDIVIFSASIFYYLLLSTAFITCINYKSRQILYQQ